MFRGKRRGQRRPCARRLPHCWTTRGWGSALSVSPRVRAPVPAPRPGRCAPPRPGRPSAGLAGSASATPPHVEASPGAQGGLAGHRHACACPASQPDARSGRGTRRRSRGAHRSARAGRASTRPMRPHGSGGGVSARTLSCRRRVQGPDCPEGTAAWPVGHGQAHTAVTDRPRRGRVGLLSEGLSTLLISQETASR